MLAPAAGAAQHDVLRQTFYNFFDSNLAVHIDTDAAGEVRVIRGSEGRVEVAGRASGGIASYGLDRTGRRTLTLTAIGSDHVTFVVVVPEDVRVHLRLPGHRVGELVGSMRRSATYTWQLAGQSTPARTFQRPQPASPIVLDQGSVPGLIQIRNAHSIQRLTLRLEHGAAFALAGPIATSVIRQPPSLAIAATPGTEELRLTIPAATSTLLVTIDGRPALEIIDGRAFNRCDPVIEQHLDDGSRWFTYTPAQGVACGRAVRGPAGHRS